MNAVDLESLNGHRLPGGTYRIEHWENWLLTDCTGADPLPDGLVHPIAMFHVPILGAGTTVRQLFDLVGAEHVPGAVRLDGYDWEYMQPLREEIDYRVEGRIDGATRLDVSGAIEDLIVFVFDVFDGDAIVARATNRWRIRRPA